MDLYKHVEQGTAGVRSGATAMILDPGDFLKAALIVIVVIVVILIVLPYLSGRGRR